MSLAAKQSSSQQEVPQAPLIDNVSSTSQMDTVSPSVTDTGLAGGSSGHLTPSVTDEPMDFDQGDKPNSIEAGGRVEDIPVCSGGRSVDSERNTGGRGAIEHLRDMNIPGVEIYTPEDFTRLTNEEQEVRY